MEGSELGRRMGLMGAKSALPERLMLELSVKTVRDETSSALSMQVMVLSSSSSEDLVVVSHGELDDPNRDENRFKDTLQRRMPFVTARGVREI